MKSVNLLKISSIIILAFITQSCSVSSDEVMPDHITGYEYNKMTCSELEGEMDYLQRAANDAAGIVDQRKDTQDGKDAAAFLFFWPALFFTDTNAPEAKKYAQLKGEFEAAKRVHRRKNCS